MFLSRSPIDCDHRLIRQGKFLTQVPSQIHPDPIVVEIGHILLRLLDAAFRRSISNRESAILDQYSCKGNSGR